MKKISLVFIFACCTMAIMAQDAIKVDYKGARPTIVDFARAFLFYEEEDEDECDQEANAGISQALVNYLNGVAQNDNVKFVVDEKNGYILYEWVYESHMTRAEMCYWNEADKKHKLFAYSTWLYEDGVPAGGQYDGIIFYRYNNATKKMELCPAPGFDAEYYNTTYTLPRNGKDIIVSKWDDNGRKTQKTLKWNGRRFSK